MSTATKSRRPVRSKPRPAAQHGPYEGFSPEEVAITHRIREVCSSTSGWLLEKELGINHETIRRVLNGQSRPSARVLVAICERYEVRAEWLLLGRGVMRAQTKGGAKPR